MTDRIDSVDDLDHMLKQLVAQSIEGDTAGLTARLPAIAEYIAANPQFLQDSVLDNLLKLAEAVRERGDTSTAGEILSILVLKFDQAAGGKCYKDTRLWAMTHIIKLEKSLSEQLSTSLLRHSMELLRFEVEEGIGVTRGVHFSQWAVTNVVFPTFQSCLDSGMISEAEELLDELMLLLQKVYGRKTSILDFFMAAFCQTLRKAGEHSKAKDTEQRLKKLNRMLDARHRNDYDFTFPALRPAVDIWDQGRWHAHFEEYRLAAAKLQQAFEDKDQQYAFERAEIAKEWAAIEIRQFDDLEKAMSIACEIVNYEQKNNHSMIGTSVWAEQEIWQPIIERWILSGRLNLALSWLLKIRPILDKKHGPYDATISKFTRLTQRCLEGHQDSAMKSKVDELVARQSAHAKIVSEYNHLWHIAYEYVRKREFQQALEHFEQCEAVAQGEDAFPDLDRALLANSRHHCPVAVCYLGLKRWAEAEARLEKASSFLPAEKRGLGYVLENMSILKLQMDLAFGTEEFARVNRLAMTLIVELDQVSSIQRCYYSVIDALNQSQAAIIALLNRKCYGRAFEEYIHLLETLERHFSEELDQAWIVRLLEKIFRETPEDILAEQFRMRIAYLRR